MSINKNLMAKQLSRLLDKLKTNADTMDYNADSMAHKLYVIFDKLSGKEIKFIASEIGLSPPPAPVVPYGSKIVEDNSSVNMTLAHKWLSVFRTLSPENASIVKSKLNPFNVSTTTPPPPPSRQYTHPLNKKSTRKTSRHHRKTHKNKRK
jgi:hypothetical protein